MRVGFNARIRRGKRFPIFSKVGRNKKKNYVNLSVVRISYLRDTNKLRNCDNSVFRSERAAGCIFIDQRGRFYDMSHSFRIADAQLSLLTNVIEPCCFYVREEVQELSFFFTRANWYKFFLPDNRWLGKRTFSTWEIVSHGRKCEAVKSTI